MRATARVSATRHDDGTTRLPVLRSEPPLLLRATVTGGPAGVGSGTTGPVAGAGATVYLVGGAAGPLGGDELRLVVDVGPGADLCLRTVAASVALPGHGGARSRLSVRADVAAGGRLVWLPEPLVAGAGCRHLTTGRVELAGCARLVWRDELVCGRHGEQPGDATTGLRVVRHDRTVGSGPLPLHHHELSVGPTAPGWDGPAVLAGARATGSLLLVDPWWSDAPAGPVELGPTGALLPLAGSGAVATVTAPEPPEVRRHLDTVLARYGDPPGCPPGLRDPGATPTPARPTCPAEFSRG